MKCETWHAALLLALSIPMVQGVSVRLFNVLSKRPKNITLLCLNKKDQQLIKIETAIQDSMEVKLPEIYALKGVKVVAWDGEEKTYPPALEDYDYLYKEINMILRD